MKRAGGKTPALKITRELVTAKVPLGGGLGKRRYFGGKKLPQASRSLSFYC